MKRLMSFFLIMSLFVTMHNSAYAASEISVTQKKAMLVARSAIYGMSGGFVIGIASQAFRPRIKNIFLAGSLGLYAGIILGLVIVSGSHGTRYDGPDTYKDEDYSLLLEPAPNKSIGFKPNDDSLRFPIFSANF